MRILNAKFKYILSRSIFVIISFFNKLVPHDNSRILMYSKLGFRDNTKSLYDYLVENGYNKQFVIVCCVSDYKELANKNTNSSVIFKNSIWGIIEYLRCNFVFYSFGKLPIIPHKHQKVIQMWHGTPFKAPGKTMLKSSFDKGKFYTHIFATSEMFVPIMRKWFLCPKELICINGHPRTDVFYKKNIKYDLGNYDKLVLWVPTFRSSSTLGYSDVDNAPLIPIIDPLQYSEIDKYLKEKNIKLVIKLHPLQDLSNYRVNKLSHFILLSHQEFVKNNLDLYTFAAQSDALITDYSSIFFDYLLLNRPIGFTEDDIEDFEDNRGFSIDDHIKFRPGIKIREIDDLLFFIEQLSLGIDMFYEDRIAINNLVNKYQDGNNSLRTLKIAGIIKTL